MRSRNLAIILLALSLMIGLTTAAAFAESSYDPDYKTTATVVASIGSSNTANHVKQIVENEGDGLFIKIYENRPLALASANPAQAHTVYLELPINYAWNYGNTNPNNIVTFSGGFAGAKITDFFVSSSTGDRLLTISFQTDQDSAASVGEIYIRTSFKAGNAAPMGPVDVSISGSVSGYTVPIAFHVNPDEGFYEVKISGCYGTANGDLGSYQPGDTVYFSTEKRPGYTFIGWTTSPKITVNNYNNTSAYFIMPACDVNIIANWNSGSGAVSTDPGTGKYEVKVDGSYASSTGAGSYRPGDTVTIRAGTREGYSFDGWTYAAAATLDITGYPTTTFTMPSCSVTVTTDWVRNNGSNTDNSATTTNPAKKDLSQYIIPIPDRDFPLAAIDPNGQKKDDSPPEEAREQGKPAATLAELLGASTLSEAFEQGNTDFSLADAYAKGNFAYPFTDITSHWANGYITILWALGVVNGTGDGRYQPDNMVTRAEFMKMLTAGFGVDTLGPDDAGFTDVDDSSWYAGPVNWAAANGVVNGYGDGRFGPDEPASRQDIAVITQRFCAVLGIKLTAADLNSEGSVTFKDDASISGYAYEAVYTLQQNQIVQGTETGEFKPQSNTTRAEMAKIVCLLLQHD